MRLMNRVSSTILAFLAVLHSVMGRTPESLTGHLRMTSDLGELHDARADWTDGVLKISAAKAERHAWVVVPAPKNGWNIAGRAEVSCEISNTGDNPVGVMFWVVGNHGWDAVLEQAVLTSHEVRRFSCNLRATFPDGTPRLNPGDVKQVQVMLSEVVVQTSQAEGEGKAQGRWNPRITKAVSLEVRNISAQGEAPEWKRPEGRIDLPSLEDCAPAPGKRVRYRPAWDDATGIYSILYLPEGWQAGRRYPVIVEFPGNVFYAPACYSTGLPDQCVIGHGMTKGKGTICLGLPFVERTRGRIVENGWGNADDTADHAMRMVAEVCDKFGGDPENIVLTGFSRGAIACGYIGLRNERIASLWRGFHACQHYDGDGWNGASLAGALERGVRFRGRSVFQTDNPREKFQPVMDVMNTQVIWADSGLGFHSTAMFLDDRPSTQQLREWFSKLVGAAEK